MCLAIPGQVLDITDDRLRMATVSFGGVTKAVSLMLVPEAEVGDYVIVHVGFAISRLDEETALRSLELLGQPNGGGTREGRQDTRGHAP
jgi:hydrogenase expression/formation protein HypC